MPPLIRSAGDPRATEKRIGDALGGAARCRLGALPLRDITAIDIAAVEAIGLHADRIVRIIGLGLYWRRHQDRRDREDRRSRNERQGRLRKSRSIARRKCPKSPWH